ncbi:codanin-1 isoform X2 [Fopius arisanus]|uniref:Codanin-1 isoform X2 n=1 Tax=Fopius arisanus TaxID=64838 RepID=A0A9R1TN34_9HYME|nr:PREDICTED: codanin-1 isoform X2 [Fopius arisanus]
MGRFLGGTRKDNLSVIQNGPSEGEASLTPKKVVSEKISDTSTPVSSSLPDQLNLTCHTSTPLKNPGHNSPCYLNLTSSSFNQSSTSSRLESSPINTSMESEILNSSVASSLLIPDSPIYDGPIRRPKTPAKKSYMEEDFPALGQTHRRISKCNVNSSSNVYNSLKFEQNYTRQRKNSTQLGDFLVTSKKSSRRNNSTTQAEKSIDDVGVNIEKDLSNQKKTGNGSKRRIKPTKLEVSGGEGTVQSQLFGVISRPETKNPQFLEAQTTDQSEDIRNFESERALLKLERERKSTYHCTTELSKWQVHKATKSTEVSTCASVVTPRLSLVDNMAVLDKLADLYGNLIRRNLVPNVMAELYFIMTLIISQSKGTEHISLNVLGGTAGCKSVDEGDIEVEFIEREKTYLSTPHNCVYFATNILIHQKDLLVVLDRTTIKLLYENHHIETFKPELRHYLVELYDKKVLESNEFKETDIRTFGTNVCFQVDTDNRENFPSTIAFSKFRKQRDLFYQSLKIWEDGHQASNWCFSSALTRKINSLISLHDETVNYYHLARLFKSQLLTSCLQHPSEDSFDDQTLPMLKSWKSANLEKFKQLQGRLVTPLSSDGIVPRPSFPGVQEFYRDFLLTSANTKFNSILENCFIQEITDLNSTAFSLSDMKARETNLVESMKQKYFICICSLQLLSKFLGFLVSIPFKSEAATLIERNIQISLRSHFNPSLNLQKTLLNALVHKKLTLTIPWMVEYLAVMDPVAFRLPYYIKVCQVLYYIYRNSEVLTSPKGSLLITFILGRLFELPNFPKDLYFTCQSTFNDQRIRDEISSHLNQFEWFEDSLSPASLKKTDVLLDELELIDDRIIITCCSFLKEFKILLISETGNFGNINRHITPVSTQLSQPSTEPKVKALQLQQEDAFFHGQPDSVKKTVDFVAERIASNAVKHICRELIPSIKRKHFTVLRKAAVETMKSTPDFNNRKEKQFHHKFLNSENSPNLVALIIRDLRDYGNESIPRICQTKCTKALFSLLSEDTHTAVMKMCVKICMRLSIEKINQWLNFYIGDAVNFKQTHSEYLVFKPKQEAKEANIYIHDSSTLSPTQIIDLIRDSMWELMEKNGKWSVLTEENVLKILKRLKKALYGRKDFQTFVEKTIYVLSIDYAIHLIVYNQYLFTNTVLEEFFDLWKNYEVEDGSNKLFEGIMSCRNIQWLRYTCDSNCWKKFGNLIDRLLRGKLLEIGNFSDQCVAIFRRDLPEDVTKFLPGCMNEAIKGFNANDEETERIKMMMRWISAACSELDESENENEDYGSEAQQFRFENLTL